MSTQRGNVKKQGPPKHQNKSAWKNVYHDTSIQTKRIIATEISGVCSRCKDCIDWKIKYKKYKPLTQAKTCVICKQRSVTQAYHTCCTPCSTKTNKCAKCGENKDIIQKPSLSGADQASSERQLQFELEQLPERKRRTFLRLQQKGKLPTGQDATDNMNSDGSDSEDDEESTSSDIHSDNTDQPDIQSACKTIETVEIAS